MDIGDMIVKIRPCKKRAQATWGTTDKDTFQDIHLLNTSHPFLAPTRKNQNQICGQAMPSHKSIKPRYYNFQVCSKSKFDDSNPLHSLIPAQLKKPKVSHHEYKLLEKTTAIK
jgi:hypothetical protein